MEEGKILFRTKNDWNVIVEEKDCYVLRSRQGQAVFDKDKSALRAVINAIQKYGNAKWSKANRSGYRFQDNHRNFICSLAQVLYCVYHRLSHDALLHGSLKYKDGNQFNLRKANLTLPQKQSIKLISILGKQYILLRIETDGHKRHCAVVNYDPVLYDLLSTIGWQFVKSKQCLGATIRRTAVDKQSITLYHVVWAYFHYRDVTKDNLSEKIKELQMYMRTNELSVDHKKVSPIGGRWDNRIENLQLIPKTLNSSKTDSTSRLHGNLFYIPTTNGEIYGHYDWTNGYINFCENESDATVASIDQLRRFCKAGEFQETDNHYKVPLNSPKGVEIQQADFRETKLYSEVLKVETL